MISGFFRKDLQEKVESLEEKTASLEKENEKLRKRLSKREEKKETDPAKFQETAEDLKRTKAALEALEKKLKSKSEEGSEFVDERQSFFLESFYLPRKKSLELLSRLGSLSAEKDSLTSIYLMPGEKASHDSGIPGEILSYIDSLKSETGIIGFFDLGYPSLLSFFTAPPFPPGKSVTSHTDSFECSTADEIFSKERHSIFILAHAGESYIGIATEKGLLKGSLVTSSVKEKHSKGGWSQKRFERLREEDIRHHTEKAGENLKELLLEYRAITDTIVVFGDRKTGSEIIDYTGEKDIPVLYRQCEIKPDRYAGEKLAKELWSARWYKV
ncbi:MAG: Vms1/Ankzf1 family peptidyl-tRNA hydrolase [Methanomicrobium sp.]|nr:Vms1/Ankzf1 family peptidyl-tRNA hydrolase [Methanomicrobium sp.]MDD4299268.1 Vms1/Ankzf1 family peptidyl-tRNA hydrolase [Methanomicrobium sp.]